jgi:hypothetical protein
MKPTGVDMRKQRLIRALKYLVILVILTLPTNIPALEITSVSPSRVSPGESVTVSGGLFTRGTQVVLGNQVIEPAGLSEKSLIFTVPALEEGDYSLQVQDEGETSPQTFILGITAADPWIDSLSPANIDTCIPLGDNEVTVQGRHFQPGATLLLDGKTIASSQSGSDTISFTPPHLSSGVYGIQVANPNGGRSIPHSLYVNDIPEINNVYTGEEFVNYYQLVIEGKNFFFNSTLLINEYPVGVSDRPPEQRVVRSQSASSDPNKQASPSQSDNVRFVDCGTLIYNRYPYSTQPKPVSLKIINPDGKTSSTWDLSIP